MKTIKALGLCLVAAFALSVFVASAAQAAEPEWGHCVKLSKADGNYTEGNCQTVAVKVKEKKGVKTETPDHKGMYEWEPGPQACYPAKNAEYTESKCETVAGKTKKGVFTPDHKGKYEKTGGGKFTAEAGAGVLKAAFHTCATAEASGRRPRSECTEYYYTGTIETECTGEHASGEAAGTDEVANVSVRFTGCTSLGIPVASAGLHGEIQVNPLQGRLGYINKSAKEVGVLLEPATAGGEFAAFSLEGITLGVVVGEGNSKEGAFYEPESGHDGLISPITPIDQMTHTFTQDYRVAASGPEEEVVGNVPSSFEGGQKEQLETYLHNTENPTEEEDDTTAWSPAGQELTNTNTVEGEAEIKG